MKISRDAVKMNKCVVIGLQSTGEARTLEVLDDTGGELTDFVSTAKYVFLPCLVRFSLVTFLSPKRFLIFILFYFLTLFSFFLRFVKLVFFN